MKEFEKIGQYLVQLWEKRSWLILDHTVRQCHLQCPIIIHTHSNGSTRKMSRIPAGTCAPPPLAGQRLLQRRHVAVSRGGRRPICWGRSSNGGVRLS